MLLFFHTSHVVKNNTIRRIGMLHAQESQLIKNVSLHSDDLQALIQQEQAHNKRLGRVARGSATTDTVIGGVAGAGIGVVGSIALISGIVPGFEGMAALGATLPIAVGATLAGVGTLVGSFVDLDAVANLWRR
jgi:hypothetical protein